MMGGVPGIWLSRLLLAANAYLPWAVGLTLLLWLLLLVLAWRRPQRRLLPLRLILITLAMGSLLLTAVQPGREVAVDPGTALLLTPGADPALVDSLREAVTADLVLTLDSSAAAGFAPAKRLPDIDYLRRHFPEVQRLHLLGYGLPAADLAGLDGVDVHFHPASLPGGIVALNYPREVHEGETITISGYYNQRDATERRLFLESPNGKEQLLMTDILGLHFFSLSVPARQAGKYLFFIVEETVRRRQLERYPLPVLIRPASRLKVLLLSDAPGFESRYLKNWLAGQGYGVAVRSAISRDRYRTEFNNLPEMNLATLTERMLAGFDVVLVPVSAFGSLPPAQRSVVRRAVANGLGVVLLAADNRPSLPAAEGSFFLDFPLLSGVPPFRLPGGAAEVELEKAPYHIGKTFGIFPLNTSSTGRVLSAFRLQGQGRVALQLPFTTYRLVLAGKEEEFARYWTTLLEGVARRAEEPSRWEVRDPLLAAPGQPLAVELFTGAVAPAGLLTGPEDTLAVPFFLEQDPLLTEQWSGRIWPRHEGWHRMSQQGSPADSSWVYVSPATAWESLRLARRQEGTQNWLAQQQTTGTAVADTLQTTHRPYPLWWFYILFVLAAGGLWLEEKW